MKNNPRIAILGAGNLGTAIAQGLIDAEVFAASQITLTRRRPQRLAPLAALGCQTSDDNKAAVQSADILLLAVEPQQLTPVLEEIAPLIKPQKHLVISVITGASIAALQNVLGAQVAIVRAMPNTAISVRASMTCIAANHVDPGALEVAEQIFSPVGQTQRIQEEMMTSATALGACGIAFFLRMIRAASQGGVEIGFHADTALKIAAQTARGATELLLQSGSHPEDEIDRVTTPRGCTIAGLNDMEHHGLSSAIIQGITESARVAHRLGEERDA